MKRYMHSRSLRSVAALVGVAALVSVLFPGALSYLRFGWAADDGSTLADPHWELTLTGPDQVVKDSWVTYTATLTCGADAEGAGALALNTNESDEIPGLPGGQLTSEANGLTLKYKAKATVLSSSATEEGVAATVTATATITWVDGQQNQHQEQLTATIKPHVADLTGAGGRYEIYEEGLYTDEVNVGYTTGSSYKVTETNPTGFEATAGLWRYEILNTGDLDENGNPKQVGSGTTPQFDQADFDMPGTYLVRFWGDLADENGAKNEKCDDGEPKREVTVHAFEVTHVKGKLGTDPDNNYSTAFTICKGETPVWDVQSNPAGCEAVLSAEVVDVTDPQNPNRLSSWNTTQTWDVNGNLLFTHTFDTAGLFEVRFYHDANGNGVRDMPGEVASCATATVVDGAYANIIGHFAGTHDSPGGAVSDVDEDDPWKLPVRLNIDDDDNDADADESDGLIENSEKSTDDDLVQVVIRAPQADEGTIELVLDEADSNAVTIYDDDGFPLTDFSVDLANPGTNDLANLAQGQDVTLWLEVTYGNFDIELKLVLKDTEGTTVDSDELHLSGIWVDVDVDSDNEDNFLYPDRSLGEDQIEDDEDKPGKFLCVNDSDGDNDGIPDYADGFGWDKTAANRDDTPPTEAQGERFVPVVVELPAPIDLASCRLKIEYSGSKPGDKDTGDGVTRTGTSPNYAYAAAAGHLRLWKKPGHQQRDPRSFADDGDFVPPTAEDAAYGPSDLAKLGFTDSQEGRKVTLYIEGIRPSSALGDQRLLIRVDPDGEGPAAYYDDALRVTVIRLDYVFAGDAQPAVPDQRIDALPLFNPAPVVTLDPVNLGGQAAADNPSIQVTGTVVSYIAPIEKDHIFVNGVPANTVTVSDSGTDDYGPFTMTFTSEPLQIGNDDFAIVAAAVNALSNIGYDEVRISVTRANNGSINGRNLENQDSVPSQPEDVGAYLSKYRFKIETQDAAAFADSNEVDVSFSTGVGDAHTVALNEKDTQKKTFKSAYIFLVPENLNLPTDATDKVKKTRLKSKFGVVPKISYDNSEGGVCEDSGVPTGILFVRNNAPINFVQSGTQQDVTSASNDITFTIEAGALGANGDHIASTVKGLNKALADLTQPNPNAHYPPVSLAGDAVRLDRVGDLGTPEHNLYRSDSAKPLMGVRTQMPLNAAGEPQDNANVVELYVNYRGYAKVTAPALTDAEGSEPVSGLQLVRAFPAQPDSEDLDPPMAPADFIRLFGPCPLVLITSEAGVGNALSRTRRIQGEVVSFVNALAAGRAVVNGQNAALTGDGNNPASGPWRYTFTQDVEIPDHTDRFSILVTAYDGLDNIGQDAVRYEIARNNQNAVTQITAQPGGTLPGSDGLNTLVDGGSVTLLEALAFLRNRQFRIEGNPLLRGTLTFMQNVQNIRVQRQIDAAGTTAGTTVDLAISGGGFATGRLVVLPPPAAAGFNPDDTRQIVADLGEFLRADARKADGNSVAGLRGELASPEGALFYRMEGGAAVQAWVVIPGHQADMTAAPAEVTLRPRIGVSGFDPVTGSGRQNVNAEIRSLDETGGSLAQPAQQQNATTTQWVNFAPVSHDVQLRRASDDPMHPQFHLFRLVRTGTNDELPVLPVSTGTYPAAASRTPAEVDAANADALVCFTRCTGLLRLESDQLANDQGVEWVLGPYLRRIVTTLTNIGTGAEVGIVDPNGDTDRDFALQIGERPVCTVDVMAIPRFPTADLRLRVERTTVDPATNQIPAASTGWEHVASLDVDPAGGHQDHAARAAAACLRLPDAAGNADHDLRTVVAARSVRQRRFEDLYLPNVEVVAGRHALPPAQYQVRPVMHLASGRQVQGNELSVSAPPVYDLNFLADFTDDLETHFELVHAALPAATRAALRNSVISQIVRLIREDYGITEHTVAGNVVLSRDDRSVRLVQPSDSQPIFDHYVVPVDFGGMVAGSPGMTGSTASRDVLNHDTDEDALSRAHGNRGIFPRAYLHVYVGNASFGYIFDPFRGANPAFGASAGDRPEDIVNALSPTGLVASAPAVPGGGLGAWNRNDRALNAYVAFSRMIAATTSHEIAHSFGLVASRPDIDAMLLGPYAIPGARAADFRVGSNNGHNAQQAATPAGQLPTYTQAGAGGVANVDDLGQLPADAQNLFMDSGDSRSLSERLEPGASGVQAIPALDNEPANAFTLRNSAQLQVVLPLDQN